jgi:hypothetical protein
MEQVYPPTSDGWFSFFMPEAVIASTKDMEFGRPRRACQAIQWTALEFGKMSLVVIGNHNGKRRRVFRHGRGGAVGDVELRIGTARAFVGSDLTGGLSKGQFCEGPGITCPNLLAPLNQRRRLSNQAFDGGYFAALRHDARSRLSESQAEQSGS